MVWPISTTTNCGRDALEMTSAMLMQKFLSGTPMHCSSLNQVTLRQFKISRMELKQKENMKMDEGVEKIETTLRRFSNIKEGKLI